MWVTVRALGEAGVLSGLWMGHLDKVGGGMVDNCCHWGCERY